MKNIKYIFSFGDSNVAGDELCTNDIPELDEYLNTIDLTDFGNVKIPQENLDEIYSNIKEIYYRYEDCMIIENQKSFSGYLSRLLDCPCENHAMSGSTNLMTYIKFKEILPSIKKISDGIENSEKVLIIYGLTSIERNTFFDRNCASSRSPAWNLHNEHREDALKYIELSEKFDNDTVAKLFIIEMQITAIRGLLPENCEIIFVDPYGLFVGSSTSSIPGFSKSEYSHRQINYEYFVDVASRDRLKQVMNSIVSHVFTDCLHSSNVYDKFLNKSDFFKVMPLGHYTERHHEIFSMLLYAYINNTITTE